jgi:predicted DNA-binding ribbon-helix-helix protein
MLQIGGHRENSGLKSTDSQRPRRARRVRGAPQRQDRTLRARDGQRAWSPKAVVVEGRCTSLRLEPIIWDALSDIAAQHNISVNEMIGRINRARDPRDNLSAAIRVYIVEFYRRALQTIAVSEPRQRHAEKPLKLAKRENC